MDYELITKKNAKSGLWANFKVKRYKETHAIVKDLAVCNVCKAEIKNTGGGTTNLKPLVYLGHTCGMDLSLFY